MCIYRPIHTAICLRQDSKSKSLLHVGQCRCSPRQGKMCMWKHYLLCKSISTICGSSCGSHALKTLMLVNCYWFNNTDCYSRIWVAFRTHSCKLTLPKTMESPSTPQPQGSDLPPFLLYIVPHLLRSSAPPQTFCNRQLAPFSHSSRVPSG